MWTFTYKQRIRDINRPVVVVATLLFVLSTAVSFLSHSRCHLLKAPKHMIVGVIRLEDGLVKHGTTFHGGSAGFFADVTQQTFATKNTIITLQTLLGDGVVVSSFAAASSNTSLLTRNFFPFPFPFREKIYRCYVVWQSVWIIILPCMMWCGVAGYLQSFTESWTL